MPRMFVYVTPRGGFVEDSATELLSAARKIDPIGPVTAVVPGYGPHLDAACESLCGTFSEVWKIANEKLNYPNAELIRKSLIKVLPADCFVLLPHDHFGMDLAPGLAIKLNATFVSDVLDLGQLEGIGLGVIRQEFGGQLSAHVQCDVSSGLVITIRPGAFKPANTAPAGGRVLDKSSEVGLLSCGRRYLETVVADAGDVDITKHDVLVSVGRGIQEKDHIGIAEELANVLGAAVSCSRPVVDAKWLEKSRQVGSSGKTVKPKVYLACGISGAFQHLAGLKGNPFIIAINKNPNAPIFQVANVGIVDDLLEFLPELSNKIREMRSATAK
jgi:electron transfer flavoprotein alpha subunit